MSNSKTATQQEPVERLRDQAAVIGHDVKELGSIAKDAAQDTLVQGRKRAQQTLADGRKRAIAMERTVEGYIRDNPVRAVAIAAGVGFITSLIFSRRS
jgi:ElaB/YqjD/DUF883 family membrane-anchored ribosome-binding protein